MQSIQSRLALPDNIDLQDIPEALLREGVHWKFLHGMRLTRESARALLSGVRNHEKMQRVLIDGEGFDPRLEKYLMGHGTRVAILAILMNERIGWCEPLVAALAAMLHDVGKEKPSIRELIGRRGRLTPAEFDLIKTHPKVGARIMAALFDRGKRKLTSRAKQARDIIVTTLREHHERMDAKGYYEVAPGKILDAARLVAVADAVDVMLTGRHYQRALPPDAAIEELRRSAGMNWDHAVLEAARPDARTTPEEQFDPKVVEKLLAIWPRDPGTKAPLPFFRYSLYPRGTA